MKFKELKENELFTFMPRKDASPCEKMYAENTVYRKFGKREYVKEYIKEGCPSFVYSVGSINVNVVAR